jgi:hypothetical protein
VTATLLVAGLASAWWNLTWTSNGGWLIALRDGRVTAGRNDLAGATRATFVKNNDALISSLALEQQDAPAYAHDDEIMLLRSWRRSAEMTHAELVPGLRLNHFGVHLNWRFEVDQLPWGPAPGAPRTFVSIPLWALAAAGTLPTTAAFLLDARDRRRAGLNHCPRCNYDRAGIPSESPCPECGGSPVPPAQIPA